MDFVGLKIKHFNAMVYECRYTIDAHKYTNSEESDRHSRYDQRHFKSANLHDKAYFFRLLAFLGFSGLTCKARRMASSKSISSLNPCGFLSGYFATPAIYHKSS
jgi:hypothetical protein